MLLSSAGWQHQQRNHCGWRQGGWWEEIARGERCWEGECNSEKESHNEIQRQKVRTMKEEVQLQRQPKRKEDSGREGTQLFHECIRSTKRICVSLHEISHVIVQQDLHARMYKYSIHYAVSKNCLQGHANSLWANASAASWSSTYDAEPKKKSCTTSYQTMHSQLTMPSAEQAGFCSFRCPHAGSCS